VYYVSAPVGVASAVSRLVRVATFTDIDRGQCSVVAEHGGVEPRLP
jgi:hypothetical protein